MIIRRKSDAWEKDEIKPGQNKDEPENRPSFGRMSSMKGKTKDQNLVTAASSM
jgi:hypothetical protein